MVWASSSFPQIAVFCWCSAPILAFSHVTGVVQWSSVGRYGLAVLGEWHCAGQGGLPVPRPAPRHGAPRRAARCGAYAAHADSEAPWIPTWPALSGRVFSRALAFSLAFWRPAERSVLLTNLAFDLALYANPAF